MTPLGIVVLGTCVLVVWLLWLEHREEVSAAARMRDDGISQEMAKPDVSGSAVLTTITRCRLNMNCTTSGLLARGADLLLRKTLNLARRRRWRKDFPFHAFSPAQVERRGAAPDFAKSGLE